MDGIFLSRKQTLMILLLVTAIGAVLRLYNLNYQSLWYDELHSIIPTDPANTLGSIIAYSKTDQPPVFFIYLFYFFKLFGYNEVVGRVASAVLGIVAIPVMFLLGRELRDVRVGLFAAALTSFNYMHVYYSQELRFYSMLFLLTCVSFLFLLRAYKYVRSIDFAFYILSTVAVLYTHYYGLVVFAVQGVTFLILLYFKRDKRFVWSSVISAIAIGLAFVPWLPVIFSDLNIESFWIRRPEPTFILDYFYYYFGKDAFTSIVFVVLLGLLIREFVNGSEKVNKPLFVILLSWLFFSYLFPYLKSILGTPILFVRYTIISLPAWILVFAIAWDLIINKKWKYGLAIALSISMLVNLILIRKHYVKVDKQQIREVSNFIKANNAGYPIYSPYPWQFGFYFKDHPVKPQALKTEALTEVDTFWLLQAEFFSPDEINSVLDPLDGKFEIIDRVTFHKSEALLMKQVSTD